MSKKKARKQEKREMRAARRLARLAAPLLATGATYTDAIGRAMELAAACVDYVAANPEADSKPALAP